MPKRKRDEADQPERTGSAKQTRIEHKLATGIAKVRHALKVAKGFEGQKLGRRRKNAAAEGKVEDVSRIEAESVALKALDLGACAKYHVCRTLCKVKAAAEHDDLPSEVKNAKNFTTDKATLNVSARLCNAKVVQEALSTSTGDVLRALGIDVDDGQGPKQKRLRRKDLDREMTESEEPMARKKAPVARLSSPPDGLGRDFGGEDESEDEFGDELNGRIANGSSEDGSDNDSIAALEKQLAEESNGGRALPGKYDPAADLSLSGSEDESRSASPEPQKAAKSTRPSAFVPSLTMAGYISGSDSEVEDIDAPRKKNRRGQRARRAIYEQKYGANAKHLQKQARNAGWDPKRGATDGQHGRGHRSIGRPERKGNPSGASGGNSAVLGNKSMSKPQGKGESEKLHPSWEAAKKAKEKKEVPVAFQGKKITFD